MTKGRRARTRRGPSVRVDLVASAVQYLDHLAPVWHALHWPIAVLLVSSIAVALADAIRPSWTRPRLIARLADAGETTLVLVSRPEVSALREAERTRGELAALGIRNLRLAINAHFVATTAGDAVAEAMSARGAAALATMPASLAALPRTTTGFLPSGTVGLDALRTLSAESPPAPVSASTRRSSSWIRDRNRSTSRR